MARILFTSVGWGDFARTQGDESAEKIISASISRPRVIFMNQSHSTVIEEVDQSSGVPSADGLITADRSVALAVRVADCSPLLLSSERWIAAIHVGRVGLQNGIVEGAIEAFAKRGEREISAIIGPAICGECYEVDPSMYHNVVEQVPSAATTIERHSLDIPAAIATILQSSKDIRAQVRNIHRCTEENSEYFSHRRQTKEGIPQSRLLGIISL